MSNESIRASSCNLNPVSLAETYPWQFEDETPAIVKDYFQAVGIMGLLIEEEFEQALVQHYGVDATEYLEAVKDKKHPDRRAALVKTGNLELALAVCSHFDGTRYEAYFSWLPESGLRQPTRVLDVGCDSGITTCFYATLFPQATITGIDKSADAIECARKLAVKLQLKNVQFIKADVLHLPNDLKGQEFDLVCSTFAADPCLSWWREHKYTVEDLLAGKAWEQTEFCEEGLAYSRALPVFCPTTKAGLYPLRKCSARITGPYGCGVFVRPGFMCPATTWTCFEFHKTEHDYFQKLPVLIGSKQVGEPPTAEEIRSLWTGDLDWEVYEDIEAESMLMATEPKKLCNSISTGSFESDDEACTQFWATESHVLIYKCRDVDRKLVRFPAEYPEHAIELLREVLDDVCEST